MYFLIKNKLIMKYENIGVTMLELVLERASLTTCGERLISKDCKILQMSIV